MGLIDSFNSVKLSKEKIIAAIRSKGVEISDSIPLDEIADKIYEIKITTNSRKKKANQED